MPYIIQTDRDILDPLINELTDKIDFVDGGPGPLNYVITKLVHNYLGLDLGNARYKDYNEAIGVLECVKLELYRRKIAQYEDGAIRKNGDV